MRERLQSRNTRPITQVVLPQRSNRPRIPHLLVFSTFQVMRILKPRERCWTRRSLPPKNHDRGAASLGTQHRPIFLPAPRKLPVDNICRLACLGRLGCRVTRASNIAKLRNATAVRIQLLDELRRQPRHLRRLQLLNTIFLNGRLPTLRLLRMANPHSPTNTAAHYQTNAPHPFSV